MILFPCSNVLSAIPKRKMQGQVISSIASHLSNEGECLFVTQFRNSDFTKMAKLPHAFSHLDGWILDTPRGRILYGLIPPEKLNALTKANGMTISKSWIKGESAFLIAQRYWLPKQILTLWRWLRHSLAPVR